MSTYINPRIYKGESLIEFPDTYVALDIETTGLSPKLDKIIEISAILYQDNKVQDVFDTLINPEILISAHISNLTGITNEMVSSKPTIKDVLPKFLEFVANYVIIGHNINFDINFIYDKCEMYQLPYFSNCFVDTLRLFKKTQLDIPNFKLSTLCDFLNTENRCTHRSLDDCYACNEIYQFLKNHTQPLCCIGEIDYVEKITIPGENENFIYKKRCLVYSRKFTISSEQIQKILYKINSLSRLSFSQRLDYILLSEIDYIKYLENPDSFFHLETQATIISEKDLFDLCKITIKQKARFKKSKKEKISAKDIVSTIEEFDESHPVHGQEFVFTGTLNQPRNDLMQLVVNLGGKCNNSVTLNTNYLVVGSFEYETRIKGEKSTKIIKAENNIAKGQDLSIIDEDTFFDLINYK